MLREIKDQNNDDDTPSIRTLCPTRWTVRANSLASIITNYNNIQDLWEKALISTRDTEIKARIRGVASQMQTFKFFFGLVLSELILRHTDKLSQTLQQPELSSVEGHDVAMLTVRTLEQIRTDEDFELYWKKVGIMKDQVDVDEPQLPRKRKAPRWFETGAAPSEFPASVEDYYRQIYFEAIDLAVTSIKNRFDHKGYKTFSQLEQLLFKACAGENFENELDFICDFFFENFEKDDLAAELSTLHQLYQSKARDEAPTVASIKTTLSSLSIPQRMLLKTVSKVLQLLLILPATNSTSERSFSALRRIKSYLRSTMSQARLNNLMILHYHQELCDTIDMKVIANEYIIKNDTRKNTFAILK